MREKSITAIIPVYNGLKYIKKCLVSIQRQGMDIEIIIIDDASTDNLNDYIDNIAKSAGVSIEYMRNDKRMGPAFARNRGILASSGEYIAFLDADDWWEDTKTESQLSISDNAELLYTGRRNIDEKSGKNYIVPTEEFLSFDSLLKRNPITCSSVILPRILAKDYLMYRGNVCEDYLMWIQMLKDGIKAEGINQPLVNYTIRKNSISHNKIKNAMRRANTYKAAGIEFHKRVYYSIYYCISKEYSMLSAKYSGRRDDFNV